MHMTPTREEGNHSVTMPFYSWIQAEDKTGGRGEIHFIHTGWRQDRGKGWNPLYSYRLKTRQGEGAKSTLFIQAEDKTGEGAKSTLFIQAEDKTGGRGEIHFIHTGWKQDRGKGRNPLYSYRGQGAKATAALIWAKIPFFAEKKKGRRGHANLLPPATFFFVFCMCV